MSMRFILIAFLSASFFLVNLPNEAVAEEKSVGKIIAIVGSVDYLSQGYEPVSNNEAGQVVRVSLPQWHKAIPRQPVFKQDQYRTSRKSRLRVLFDDSSLLALGPNAEMKIETYLYKLEEKLRDSVISVAHGFSMYIVNKSQNNKKSSFNIVTPTATMSARGTQGFISGSQRRALIANIKGLVEVFNSDPNVPGKVVGAMMKTIVEEGKPSTEPKPLTLAELIIIEKVVLGWSPSKAKGSGGNSESSPDPFFEEYQEFEDSMLESCRVEEGKPSTEPKPLTLAELIIIEKVVLGWSPSKAKGSGGNSESSPDPFFEEYQEFEDSMLESCRVEEGL